LEAIWSHAQKGTKQQNNKKKPIRRIFLKKRRRRGKGKIKENKPADFSEISVSRQRKATPELGANTLVDDHLFVATTPCQGT
jgi:hypothetical protein